MELDMEELNGKIASILVGGKKGFGFIKVGNLAEMIGASEVAIRFLLGVFAGFPFTIILMALSKSSAHKKHLFFMVTGLLINYFCFGEDFVYNLFSIFMSYISMALFGGTIGNVIFHFLFHTLYLLAGYIVNASDGYDIKWTTPQCILCLRLIGLAWDVYDGRQKKVFGFAYCFCGFLAGPQFTFKRYQMFVENSLIDKEAVAKISSRYKESFKRFIAACCLMLLFSLLDPYYRCEDQLTTLFLKKTFLQKIVHMGLVYYVQFSKYVLVWWLSESICILSGLSYNGVDQHGCPKWDGLRNFKFQQFIFGTFFQDIIESFNINTNRWAGRYLFRRLKFLGNKTLSHILTLLYLSVWHGFYVGYFIMFFMEFLAMTAETQLCGMCRKIFDISYGELPWMFRMPLQVCGAVLKFLMCGFFVQSFMLLRWRRIKVVYSSVYYWPVVLLLLWILVLKPMLTIIIQKREKLLNKTE